MHSSAAATAAVLLLLYSVSSLNVQVTVAAGESPFTPMASLRRYLKNHISNDLPEFLMNKSSPLNATLAAFFSNLAADPTSLSAHLQTLCREANLLCFPHLSSNPQTNDTFTTYKSKNFTTYGNHRRGGGGNNFTSYSENQNLVVNAFHHYSQSAATTNNSFTTYATDANVVDDSFNTYATSAADESAKFTAYAVEANSPNLRFQTYSENATGSDKSFAKYSETANSGTQTFSAYGKNSKNSDNSFTGYSNTTNTMGSNFNNYGEKSSTANNTFTNYGDAGNEPENTFKNYGGNGSNAAFANYRDLSNAGTDSFQTYHNNDSHSNTSFTNYGHTHNGDTVDFKGYGDTVGFKNYRGNISSFADYKKHSAPKFETYINSTGLENNKQFVEPGKFFKEAMLTTGNNVPIPDITDKFPSRSFLPHSIASKLPFSSAKIQEMEKIFNTGGAGSSISTMLINALEDCERPPSTGETKQCVDSIEGMVDFATSVLGRNAVVRTTENVNGHDSNVTLGNVKLVNATLSAVSCHQIMLPYLLYYCHSVPEVKVFEAEILNPETKRKVNTGVAICHLDTSSWSEGHVAFIALDSSPGETEVCHWIYENDMTWSSSG